MNLLHVKFAVIIPIHNRPEYLYSSVESVCNQTYSPIQVIIVDDFSDHGYIADFAAILSGFRDRLPITYMRLESNVGPACARNRALEILNPSVTHISFLDSDDIWHPFKLQAVARAYAYYDCDIVLHEYTSSNVTAGLEPAFLLDNSCNSAKRITSLNALLSNPCQTSCLSMTRSAMLPFPLGQRYCEDYCLILSALALGRSVFKIDSPLTLLGRAQHSVGGLSSNLFRMRIGEIRAYLKYAIHTGTLCFFPLLVFLSLSKAILLFVRLSVMRVLAWLSRINS